MRLQGDIETWPGNDPKSRPAGVVGAMFLRGDPDIGLQDVV
jgi:hypothetical protein